MTFSRRTLLLIAGLYALLFDISVANSRELCTVGVLAHRGQQKAVRMWTPTVDYLSSHVPRCEFSLVPLDLDELHEADERGELDFILTNPGHYVELEEHHGVSRIATLMNSCHDGPATTFGAVIFTLANRTDIQSLDDLRGKTFAAVDQAAFGGFQMAWRELKAAGVDPFTDFTDLQFMGFPQDEIVYAVRDGIVDAGTVRTGILERLVDQGAINIDDFRILGLRVSNEFPLLRSTRLYPEWAFAKSNAATDDLARDVSMALLQMAPDEPATRAGKYVGWTVPLDYIKVHELFQELRIGPYLDVGTISFTRVLRKYWYWLVLLTGIIVFSLILNIYIKREVVRRTAQLSEANRTLQDQIQERRRAENEVRELLDENRTLVGKSLVVQENERRNLSRELHDELGQCITAIQADAEIISGFAGQCGPGLEKSAEAIKSVSARIYDFVHSTMLRLRPSILEDLGLAETLREEVDAWQGRHRNTHCTLSINTDLYGLDEQTEITIYRIVQECLTNVVKHANACNVSIVLDLVEDIMPGKEDRLPVSMLRIIIRDDGSGMDQDSPRRRGLGLIGIRERAGALGGVLDIQTARGKGTTITVKLPSGYGAGEH